MAFLFAIAVVLVGVVPVLYFLALLGWQVSAFFQGGAWVPLPVTLLFTDHALGFIPEIPWTAPSAGAAILDRVHVGLIPALVGLAATALGVLGALRQKAAIRSRKQHYDDRVRRMRDYRSEDSRTDVLDGRREPFIGPGSIDRNTDRRVA